MNTMRLFQPGDVPGAVSSAIRSIQAAGPEYQNHLKKRMAQWTGLSVSWADKLICGQFEKLDAAHLLNADQFFDGLLIREILERETDAEKTARILEHVREIERLSRL